MGDIFNVLSLNQVIHADYLISQMDKVIAEVGAEESGSSCNQNPSHLHPPYSILNFNRTILRPPAAGRVSSRRHIMIFNPDRL